MTAPCTTPPAPSTPGLPGLYVHIPFCRSRCAYCSFVSGVYSEPLADRYIAAVHAELRARAVFSPEYPPSTLFIGGGTPSILTPKQLETLLAGLPRSAGEASCEMNPDSVTPEALRILRDYGINRLSFGVQTFSPEGLRLLGRVHDADTARRAVALAAEAQFGNINLDLINNWPGQTEESLCADINIATSLQTQHISYYSLILDPSSCGYSRLSALAAQHGDADEREGRFWEVIETGLEKKGFVHYETSNYAQPGFACRHNVATWKGGEYLGVGIGAHSHLEGKRFANTTDIGRYIYCSNKPREMEVFSEAVTGMAKAKECAVFWLRLFEGIEVREFAAKTGYSPEELYGETLRRLLESGFLEWSTGKDFLRVPKKYQPVLDSVLVELI